MNKRIAFVSAALVAVALSLSLTTTALASEPTQAAPVVTAGVHSLATSATYAPLKVAKRHSKRHSHASVTTAAVAALPSTAAVATPTPTADVAAPTLTTVVATDDLATAEAVLASLQAKYQYLDGVTVTIGATPNNYQAVSYMGRGLIVISPSHTASISTIMSHEIWHIIDYRDNGTIDWGERVAPKNAADYLK